MTNLNYLNYTADYTFVYHPAQDWRKLTPVWTLDKLLERVNEIILLSPRDELHSGLRHYDGYLNLLARMVRLNWMVDNFKHEPIRKPLVAWSKFSNWQVPNSEDKRELIVGETRFQALTLNPTQTNVPVILQVPVFHRKKYQDDGWILLPNRKAIAEFFNLEEQEVLISQNWQFEICKWFELNILNVGHHMHNELERRTMILNYLKEADSDFKFSREWLVNLVNWEQYKT